MIILYFSRANRLELRLIFTFLTKCDRYFTNDLTFKLLYYKNNSIILKYK
ncbi:hypothetical protein CLV33_10589 [Jejuia pallidilutea]|uniref:Uncharacterized protein n=1 Tax=Jejuia pallidilutea TaxID=504487 RepID=A0A362X0K0_9FLAO|nr:hypothetical protein CLV33_10589 [Jejuia pallidilutea]